jgi:hypothetical protein
MYGNRSKSSAREIATCKQNVGQKEDLMHSNFQMDINLPWIDANTKSIVKVETGIVTLISYRHYLKIVGNNKLCSDNRKKISCIQIFRWI